MDIQLSQNHTKPMMIISIIINGLVILFFALSLIIDSGYSYATVLLLLLTLGCLPFYWRKVSLNHYHYYVISAFVAMSLVGILNAWRIGSTGTEYNFPARYLVSILLLIFLSIFPPKKIALLWGIALAGIGAGLTAYYYTYYAPELLPAGRAARYMNPIQFGNISILMAMLSLIGFMHLFPRKQHYILQTILAVGTLGGLLASILSQSRGGWLAFTATVFIFMVIKIRHINLKQFSKKRWLSLFSIVVITIGVGYINFGSTIDSRLVQTKNEWQLYQQGNSATSMGARLDMWAFAWHEGWQYPIIGPNSKQMMVDKEVWVNMGHASKLINHFGHLHNEYLDAFAIKGLVGLTALMWLFTAPIIVFTKGRKYINFHGDDNRLMADLGLALVVMYMGFGLTQVSLTHHSSGFMMYVIPLCFFTSGFLNSIDYKKSI